MKFAFYKYHFGYIKIGYEGHSILFIKKCENVDKENSPDCFTDNINLQLQEYFNGKRQTFDVKLKLNGTKFEKKVWKQLLKIPYGQTRTYKQIAEMIGNAKSYRAVGRANNLNPITIIIPCHRVIGSDGKLMGYSNGIDFKQYLLNLEQKNKNG